MAAVEVMCSLLCWAPLKSPWGSAGQVGVRDRFLPAVSMVSGPLTFIKAALIQPYEQLMFIITVSLCQISVSQTSLA